MERLGGGREATLVAWARAQDQHLGRGLLEQPDEVVAAEPGAPVAIAETTTRSKLSWPWPPARCSIASSIGIAFGLAHPGRHAEKDLVMAAVHAAAALSPPGGPASLGHQQVVDDEVDQLDANEGGPPAPGKMSANESTNSSFTRPRQGCVGNRGGGVEIS